MRQETNNEMDLLLRRLGRREETAASGDHLDADELSSYAENALPPAARARYTEHLAECARCRDMVVQLSASAGAVVAQDTVKAVELSGFRKFLASLFSPMVLRYAVPALGLVIVAAIGFMVSRNQAPRPSSVAQVTDQDRMADSAGVTTPQASSSPEGSRSNVDSTTTAEKDLARENKVTETEPVAQPNTPPSVSSNVSPDARQEVAKTVEQQPVIVSEAPPPPKPATVTDGLQKLEPQGRKAPAEDRAANEPVQAAKATDDSKKEVHRSDISAARARDARTKTQPLGAGGLQSGAAAPQRDAEETKDKNDAATRTVAGRSFRRQDNAWIDTAYNSSQSVTSFKRGSEQYRGLVADEPAIKTIADQLDGEVIVVWKGRTYRIY